MKRAAAFSVFSFLLAAFLAAANLGQLLQRAKEQFRIGSYAASLKTLSQLDLESRAEGLERDRAALEPIIAFYRGACDASLGRTEEARSEFAAYLAYEPNARLDPALYSKKVAAVFEQARQSVKSRAEVAEQSNSLALAYRDFPRPAAAPGGELGETWADGPARVLLTPEERRDFARLTNPVSRSEYVTSFWKTRDPKPETSENEFREEFEKRVAFADAYLTEGETRGSLTDRGMVFLLLGPPSYIGRRPLTSGEDTADSAALSLYRTTDVRIASVPAGTTSKHVANVDRVTGPGNRVNEAASNWREVWHYRREALPKGVPYLQVDFEFVTKSGYGQNVLQRDTQAVTTLEKARALLRKGRVATRVRES